MTDDHLPPEAQAMLQQFIEQEHGYLSWLGTTVEEFTYDTITLAVPFDEKLTNPTSPPTMHGGIAATLVDTAGGLALRPSLDDPMQGGVATINLNVNYLRRAAGDMTAHAEVIRAGGSVGVSQVTVTSEVPGDRDAERSGRSEKPVAVGQGAYRLFRG
ncbi:PaaI family thioesterase [Halomarina oriensis]|uniref:Hotdog fold thioesterase n=1 Tax=Halomarina oriensis TaxID=671145 RepID=A0A6B0GN91_9EURY|nr:PaaI family thioesterase [Halomarina oriensis]MWG34969.1 hotdog fold thioesterase [Halomarina oriensis]